MSEHEQETGGQESANLPNDGRPYLVIALNADEQTVTVSGWTKSKFTAYALLGTAQDAIRNNVDKQVKIERVNGSGGLIAQLRNGFKGRD